MISQFEEKGKIFTPVINKEPKKVIIQTIHHKITGTVYVRPSDRLIDELNKNEKFLAVTEAIVHDLVDQVLFKCEFLTVNSDQIIWILPIEELKPGDIDE
jgi:hypothetical protein